MSIRSPAKGRSATTKTRHGMSSLRRDGRNPEIGSLHTLLCRDQATAGKHTFSSGGFGTPAHLIGEMFKLETGVQATHVPYVQFPQAIGDLVSGVNTYQFITILPVVQLIKAGKLRALAVSGAKRVEALS